METTGFDFADVVDDAVERAGGENTTAADIVKVRRGLTLLLNRWENQGYNSWRIREAVVPVYGGVPRVQLPAAVDDVINVNSIRQSHTESPMRRITATEYAQLATKWSTGDPSQYYLSREAGASALMVYPTGPTQLAVTYVQRPAAFERYGNSLDDVPGRWLEALITGLALDLARKRPPYNEALIQRLRNEAAEAEDIAQRADRDRTRFRYRKTSRRAS